MWSTIVEALLLGQPLVVDLPVLGEPHVADVPEKTRTPALVGPVLPAEVAELVVPLALWNVDLPGVVSEGHGLAPPAHAAPVGWAIPLTAHRHDVTADVSALAGF